jgi:hypothetical protein
MVAGVILPLAVAVFLCAKASPTAARLLHQSGGILFISFVSLKPIQLATNLYSRAHMKTSSNDARIDA